MMQTSFHRFVRLVGLFALVGGLTLSLAGCGGADRPPLGKVSGKVTIDGEPLSGVIVVFQPEDGRMAVATTDKEGYYELQYTEGVKGCKVGKATVVFSVPTGGSPSHAIPAKYQTKSDLVRDVKDGPNTFDFPLESGAAPGTAPPKPPAVID